MTSPKPTSDATRWVFDLVDDYCCEGATDMIASADTEDYISLDNINIIVSGDHVMIGHHCCDYISIETNELIQLAKVASLIQEAHANRQDMQERDGEAPCLPEGSWLSVPRSPFNEKHERVN